MKFIKKWPIASFLIGAFFITYVFGIPAYVVLDKIQREIGTDFQIISEFFLKFGPSIAGILVIMWCEGRAGLRGLLTRLTHWRFPAWMYLCILIVPPLLILISLMAAGHSTEVLKLSPLSITILLGQNILVHTILGGGLSEEIGWRGFLLPKLLEKYTPVVATFWLTIPWFLWHMPAFFLTEQDPNEPVIPFAIILLSLSFLLTWAFYRAGKSLLVPILFHGSFNASFYTLQEVLADLMKSPGFQPTFNWVVGIAWCLPAIVILLMTKFKLKPKQASFV